MKITIGGYTTVREIRRSRPLAFALGLLDGWRQPWDFSMGRMWPYPDTACNETYDRGVNVGQAVRRCAIVIASGGREQP